MSKKEQLKREQEQKILSMKILGFILLGIIVIGGIIIWISSCEPWKISNYNEMKEVTYSNYLEKDGNYYVFVYNSKDSTSEDYETKVCEYAEAVRKNSTLPKIYFYDYSKEGNSKIYSSFETSSSNVTRLIYISDSDIETEYVTWAKINTQLESLTK